MKSLICLIGLVFCMNAIASTPFHPYEEVRFSAIEANIDTIEAQNLVAGIPLAANTVTKKTGRFVKTFSNNATGSTFSFGTLPAYAVVTNSYLDVVTDVLPVNASNTLAAHCVAANDIFTAADISSASSDIVMAGTVTGGATAVEVTSAGCNLVGTIGSGAGSSAFASGKVILFVDFLLSE